MKLETRASLHPGRTVIPDVACTICGCVCDDLQVEVDAGRVVKAVRACPLAEPWFLMLEASSHFAQHRGEEVSVQQKLAAAVDILKSSNAPLVYGLSRSSTPGQRAAVALADRIGAVIDTTASTCHAPSIVALQSCGESTCSLGEIRDRADLVVYWGSNPVESHPRHIERFVDAPGRLTPRGRADRHLVVIDVQETKTARLADTFIQVAQGGDFDLLWALRGIVRGLNVQGSSIAGVPMNIVQELAQRLKASRYGAVFFGLGLTKHGPGHLNVEALLKLVTDVHRHTRCVARRMRIPGDVAGVDSVLCWQTGFPFSVSLARTYPRYNPGEFTANDLLAQGEVDAVLLVGSDGVNKLSLAAQRTLCNIPSIVLDPPGADCPFEPTVHITTAIYGVHRPGTAYRMDEIPIPLTPFLHSSLPADHEVLAAMTSQLATQH